jgi:Zn-dependent metalloprotease
LTKAIDVVAHELTHGVVSHECNLEYQDESGALNEHFADVFGTLVKQWSRNETVTRADWLIGDAIMGPETTAKSLRTFKAGLAYENDPLMGTDPQPKHVKNKFTGTADRGGVHINSGIPNHAFFLAATALDGNAWETLGPVWYETLKALNSRSSFQDAARMTIQIAGQMPGGQEKQRAIQGAWKAVGL